MALTKVLTGGIALDAVDNTILKLDDDYALTGTVSGAGTILQVKKVTWTAEFQSTSTSFTDITPATLSFTPVSASSTLKISCFFHIYLGKGGSTNVGGSFQILHNGSAIEAPDTEQYKKQAGSGTAINQLPHSFSNYVASGNTNARTIKAQGKCLFSGSEFLVNKGGTYTSHIEVMEVNI